MPVYKGSCHCGTVKFRVDTILDKAIECNCSICTKKGALHHRVTADNFILESGKDALALYQFDTREAKHHFCKICGIHPFTRPRANPELYSINLRCLDDIDFEKLEIEIIKFDGKHWEEAMAKLQLQSN